MLANLKTDFMSRAVLFEHLARIKIRKIKNNNFIFSPRYFDNIYEIILKYKLNIDEFKKVKLTKEVLDFLKKHWTSIDLIEFVLDNKENRIVKDLLIYEVKTKSFQNTSKFELCISSYETYKFLELKKFKLFLVSFILFENWRYSFNLYKLNLNNFRIYTRFNK